MAMSKEAGETIECIEKRRMTATTLSILTRLFRAEDILDTIAKALEKDLEKSKGKPKRTNTHNELNNKTHKPSHRNIQPYKKQH